MSRQFKVIFHRKGSVFLSGADLLEMTDNRTEVNLLFEPCEPEEIKPAQDR